MKEFIRYLSGTLMTMILLSMVLQFFCAIEKITFLGKMPYFCMCFSMGLMYILICVEEICKIYSTFITNEDVLTRWKLVFCALGLILSCVVINLFLFKVGSNPSLSFASTCDEAIFAVSSLTVVAYLIYAVLWLIIKIRNDFGNGSGSGSCC